MKKKKKKKNKEKRVDSEADDVGMIEFGGDEIGNSEGDQRNEKPLDDGKKKKTVKRKLDDTDLGAEENTEKESKKKRKKVKPSVNSEIGGNNEDQRKMQPRKISWRNKMWIQKFKMGKRKKEEEEEEAG